jgi:hypothetical protein
MVSKRVLVKEYSDMTGLSDYWIRRQVKLGNIPAIFVGILKKLLM